jgi:hypothetical protein
MVEAAAAHGWIDREAAILETLGSIHRAGADVISPTGPPRPPLPSPAGARVGKMHVRVRKMHPRHLREVRAWSVHFTQLDVHFTQLAGHRPVRWSTQLVEGVVVVERVVDPNPGRALPTMASARGQDRRDGGWAGRSAGFVGRLGWAGPWARPTSAPPWASWWARLLAGCRALGRRRLRGGVFAVGEGPDVGDGVGLLVGPWSARARPSGAAAPPPPPPPWPGPPWARRCRAARAGRDREVLLAETVGVVERQHQVDVTRRCGCSGRPRTAGLASVARSSSPEQR